MALSIAVCLKPVPDPKYYDKITIDPIDKTIVRTGIPTIINPVDKNALEAALRLKEQFGGKVTVISMAPPNAAENLREALAMGADEACLLSDRAFAGADTLATSYTLAQGLRKVGGDFDLVFCGSESADGATAQVASQLGEWLGVPHLWNVFHLEAKSEKVYYLKTKTENGYMEWEAQAPLVIAVSREINRPRYTSIMGVMKAKNKKLETWKAADLELDLSLTGLGGSPTKAGEISTPDLKRKSEKLKGEPEDLVQSIIAKLRAGGLVLDALDTSCERGSS